MLNELAQLVESRQTMDAQTESWNEHYKTCPGGTRTFRLLISSDATVTEIEPVSDREEILGIRKWEVAAGVSFPAFNVWPLFHATSGQAKEAVKQFLKLTKGTNALDRQVVTRLIDTLAAFGQSSWETTYEAERIQKCLTWQPSELLKIVGAAPHEFRAIQELITRVKRIKTQELQTALRECVTQNIIRQPSQSKDWLDSLIVSTAKSPKRACLVFDVADRLSFDYPANHEKVRAWINERLHADQDISTQPTETNDAFGRPADGANRKFPSVKLPVLGSFSIRAMNSESPCQFRYQRADQNSFVVGREIRQRMKKHLEWLGNPTRRRRTWQDISGTCGFTKRIGKKVPLGALLFAYPSDLPVDPPELAGLFGGVDLAEGDSAKFEACSARVIPALDGIVNEHPNVEIRIFALMKRDKARTKVVASEKLDARRLIDCAKSWQEGARNLPRIVLNLGTDHKPNWTSPLTPFPAELVKCLNVIWLRDATRPPVPVHALDFGAGLALLMDHDARARLMAQRVLSLAIRNATPLLLAMGHADHRRDGKIRIVAKYQKHRRLIPSIIALLLAKLGSLKGDYMHTSPYLVGRMLALTDTLHKEYCVHHRKDVPSQLIGNATMAVALDNPVSAMARLAERLPIYQSWANTTTEEKGFAGWALAEMGDVSPALATVLKPEPCDELAKAQMLLGYLARSKGEEKVKNKADKSEGEGETNHVA